MRTIIKILLICFLASSASLNGQLSKDNYSSNSVLSSGKWFKIAVTTDGVYRIDYQKLKQLGLENASNPRIYGNNFGQMSYYNDDPKPDDLKELPIMLNTGNDGIFNEGDYLLFYASGTGRWKYDTSAGQYAYSHHNYSDTAYYFLTSGSTSGKLIKSAKEPSAQSNYSSLESDALFYHEQDELNMIKSGREWFQPVTALHIDPGFSELITSEPLKFNIRVGARASVPVLFRLYEGTTVKKSIQTDGVILSDDTGTYFQISDSTGSFIPDSSSPDFDLKFFNNGEQGALGLLDFVQLQGRRANTYNGSFRQFSDSKSVSTGRITQFTISGNGSDPLIWDISDPENITQITYSRDGVNLNFKCSTDSLRTFAVFSPSSSVAPSIKSVPTPAQNLHASSWSDMVIITHPMFRAYAEKIAAIHLKSQGLVTQIVTPVEIYNEFSGGITDIVALRNFLRMKYLRQKGSSHPLKYLLLLGDGSFENKTPPPDNPDFIPTYQSQNSNIVVQSFTSDDFYGLLDDGEGEAEGTEDIGIGRIPVSDTVQAGIAVSKIRKYLDPVNMGDWKNIICLSADDEDGNTHLDDAEGLASVIKASAPAYNIDKIYLDAYKQAATVNGQSYPDVNKAITDRINSGCLIFNYTGHGNENGLAAERVVKTDDINSWNNGGKLPLFITATCEFSRFDDAEQNVVTKQWVGKPSGGELIFLNKNGGGIALMSTTRLVYSAPNYILNKNIFSTAFTKDGSGNPLCLGDIIRIAKNNSGEGPNKRNFTLLGDPALYLEYPYHGTVITDSVNRVPVTEKTDTLKALSVINISGHIEDQSGKTMNTFNGVVSPVIYDKPRKIKTLANDGGTPVTFSLRNNVLFSGKTLAKAGRFTFTFIVPRDIDYTYGSGKISYYAASDSADMNGSFEDVIVGGFSNSTSGDTSGPGVRLFMNDTLFRDGGITDNKPKLLAIISDKSGINTSGAGIGHDITAYLDNNPSDAFSLNNYFDNDFDNFMEGRVSYDLSGLTEGDHTITLKAWDNLNNSTEKTIHFKVVKDDRLILKNLLNYPNPFLNNTAITLEHNRPGSELSVSIKIYRVDGSIIRILKERVTPAGYNLPAVTWDGNDEGGRKAARGMYLYTITISTENGDSSRLSGRMIIL
jgi:hypothetical protein